MKGKPAESFEELHIYQRARELTNEIYGLSRDGLFARDLGLVDQIRRAAVSVMSNTAEGFERGTTPEFVQFLYIAKGSCGEVRAQLQIAADQQYIRPDQHARLNDMSRRISGMISILIANLQSSEYRGEKFSRPGASLPACANARTTPSAPRSSPTPAPASRPTPAPLSRPSGRLSNASFPIRIRRDPFSPHAP
jgi:four helix bundle protein